MNSEEIKAKVEELRGEKDATVQRLRDGMSADFEVDMRDVKPFLPFGELMAIVEQQKLATVVPVRGGHVIQGSWKSRTVLKVGDVYRSYVTYIRAGELEVENVGESDDWITAYGKALNDIIE